MYFCWTNSKNVTVVRTSTEVGNNAIEANHQNQYDKYSFTSNLLKMHHTNTAMSEENLTRPNGDSAKKVGLIESRVI